MPTPPPPPSPFLGSDPPHWAARGLAYLLLILFATAVIAAIVVRVPETVTSAFVLQPTRGTDPVRVTRSGTVAAVRIAEGQTVERGEPLYVLRSIPVGERTAELRGLQTELAGHQAGLENLRREYDSQQRAEHEESERLQFRLEHLNRSIGFRQQQLAMLKEMGERYKTLNAEGLVGWTEYAEQELEINRATADLEAARNDVRESQKSLEKLRHESAARTAKFQETQRQLTGQSEQARIRIAALQRELGQTTADELVVNAPCAGTVLRLRVNSAGAYVPEGDVLCELSCDGERLQAELVLAQSGLGRLQPGQPVKLLYDAFPYQRYGIQYGTVRWVSPASVAAEHGAQFRAFVDLLSDVITVEGNPRPLRPGMGGTARVVVARPRLITYAFEPLRQLRENFAGPPAAHKSSPAP